MYKNIMKNAVNTALLASGLISTVLLSACASGPEPAPLAVVDQAVRIRFTAVNGNTPVQCGTRLVGLGRSAVAADVKDLRFYITNLALVNAQGVAVPVQLERNVWQHTEGADAVALIDMEDASGSCASPYTTTATNAVITGKVPPGDYVGLRASMGVPEALNHGATSGGPPPLDIAAMAWSWQAGRRFAKIELSPLGSVTRKGRPRAVPDALVQTSPVFSLHLGSSGCTAQVDAVGIVVKDAAGNPRYSCTHPNRADFTLPRFDATTQRVALDIGQLFKSVNLSQDEGGAVGCMAGPTDPECVGIFEALQVSFGDGSNGLPINAGVAQTVFRAVMP